jgi:hypothetical protein
LRSKTQKVKSKSVLRSRGRIILAEQKPQRYAAQAPQTFCIMLCSVIGAKPRKNYAAPIA